MAFKEFYDITGENFGNVPLVSGNFVAVYVTGTNGIQETAAQDAAATAAGMGLITIDQTPGLQLFAEGKADVADIEQYAGTGTSANEGIEARRAIGLTQHCLYVSQDSWAALQAAVPDQAGVVYWIANYGDSDVTAEDFITANGNVVAVQFGDPASNPATEVPGTSVTLSQAQADIDMGLVSWLDQFLPSAPPAPPSPTPTEAIVNALPLVQLGDTGVAVSRVQALLLANVPGLNLGATGPHKDGIDGDFGPLTEAAVHNFQASFGADGPGGTGVDGIVGPGTWAALLGV